MFISLLRSAHVEHLIHTCADSRHTWMHGRLITSDWSFISPQETSENSNCPHAYQQEQEQVLLIQYSSTEILWYKSYAYKNIRSAGRKAEKTEKRKKERNFLSVNLQVTSN